VIAHCGVIWGCDDFCVDRRVWPQEASVAGGAARPLGGHPLARLLKPRAGALRPGEFEKCLQGFVTSLHELTGGQIVAIDGKTLRRSFDESSGKAAIHMVSAWAMANCINLGQVTTDEKSNEIMAIPRLLEMLTNDGTYSYTYDAEGNRLTRTLNDTSGGLRVTEYTWDHRNRLTKVTEKLSGVVTSTVEYGYDALNRLVRRIEDADGPGPAWATNQFFVYDGNQVVLQFGGDSVDDLSHRYLSGIGVDQLLAD